MYKFEDPHLFLIEASNGDWAEAEDEDGAFLAYHTLHREALHRVKVKIINQHTNTIVWEDR